MSFWKLRNEVKLRLKSFEDEIDYFICLCAPLNFLSSSDTAQVGGWSSELQFKRVQSYSPQRCSAQAYLPDDRFFSSSRSLCSDLLMSIWDYLLQHQTELYACNFLYACNSGRNYSHTQNSRRGLFQHRCSKGCELFRFRNQAIPAYARQYEIAIASGL